MRRLKIVELQHFQFCSSTIFKRRIAGHNQRLCVRRKVMMHWDSKRRVYMEKHKLSTRQWTALVCIVIFIAPWLVAAVTQIDLTTQVKGVLPTANGGTGTSNAATGTAGGAVLSNSPSIATPTLSSPIITGAMGSNIDMGSAQAVLKEIANAGTTGTTVNKLAKLTGAPSTVIITATTDIGGIEGIVVAGAGTT